MMDNIIKADIQKVKDKIKKEAFEQKRVLVTGGAGFIGSWLCDVLIEFGARVIVVDDLSTGRISNINHLVEDRSFKLVQSDVCKYNSKEKIDIIFHMAGHASPDEYQMHPIETLQTSAIGTEKMAEIARKNDAILLFASTSEVYGDAEIVPTPEYYWGKVNPIGTRSCYDEGKRFAEALLMAYYRQYGLDIKVPRIFNSYGPRLREDGLYGRAMSRFILQAHTNMPLTVYGDGIQTRSFCYITDTIEALLLLATNEKAKGEVINIGNNQEVTILELAKKIQAISRSESPIVFCQLPKDDPKRRCPDIAKAQAIIYPWKPALSLEKGVSRTIEWFLTRHLVN